MLSSYFVLAHSVFQFEQITQVTTDISSRGVAAGLVELQARNIPVCLTTTRVKSGRCISDNCLVGESTFEAVVVFVALVWHLMLAFFNLFQHFQLQICISFSRQRARSTKTSEAKEQSSRERQKGAAMSGGDVVCSGWLRKSPPEKKLRRYVSALYIPFIRKLLHKVR